MKKAAEAAMAPPVVGKGEGEDAEPAAKGAGLMRDGTGVRWFRVLVSMVRCMGGAAGGLAGYFV